MPVAEEFESDPGYPFLAVTREDKIAFSSKPFDSKKNRWVPGFVAAEIKSESGDSVTVVTTKGNEVTVKKDEAQGNSRTN
ncbi:Myosin N-terminal SH3-like domain-containing protein [Aphelenchoides fujianensis]|nr:Myosin N-terminal SH3-like domain-containing protein [Aphelenchoides fujianensis]